MMGRRLHLPRNVDDRQLVQICQEIPQETIRVFYNCIPHHVAACILAREGSELASMVGNDAKMVAKVAANLVSKNDANLAQPPSSH
ncbi:hypothetical protein TNCV_4888941 [Trichonephila clavipes]|nr:hypothetical protein TNCV_4888941 [Trichonephila clavipes]